MRNTSSQLTGLGGVQFAPGPCIRHTLPKPVVPSPVHALPSGSNATPLLPGTPDAKAVVGLLANELAMAAQSAEAESSDAQPTWSGTTIQRFPPDAASAI